MRCRSRRYSGSRLLIKCQTKQKSMSVFFSGNRPAICSSFIHSLTCLLCACVDVCVCVCVSKHSSSQQPTCWPSVQRHWCCCPEKKKKKKKKTQQLCVRWLGHMTTAACDWPGHWAKNAGRNPRLMSFLGDSDSEWTQQERIPKRILTEKESLKRLKEGERKEEKAKRGMT